MTITQIDGSDAWVLAIQFGAYTFTNGNGPFYIAGDFNQWRIEDERFRIQRTPNGGANTLLDTEIRLDPLLQRCEFKVWEAGHKVWLEPDLNHNSIGIYMGIRTLCRNAYGSWNVYVERG